MFYFFQIIVVCAITLLVYSTQCASIEKSNGIATGKQHASPAAIEPVPKSSNNAGGSVVREKRHKHHHGHVVVHHHHHGHHHHGHHHHG